MLALFDSLVVLVTLPWTTAAATWFPILELINCVKKVMYKQSTAKLKYLETQQEKNKRYARKKVKEKGFEEAYDVNK